MSGMDSLTNEALVDQIMALKGYQGDDFGDDLVSRLDVLTIMSRRSVQAQAPLTELLPCPFCGSIDMKEWAVYVQCNNCQALGPDAEFLDAIAAWNRRASQAAPAPSDGLREAAVDALELAHGVSFSKSPTIAQWGQRVEAKLRAALSASPAQDVIIGFSDGDVPCRVCGKVIHLYFNGGELDEASCCGHTYRTEAVGYRLVISASPAQEVKP